MCIALSPLRHWTNHAVKHAPPEANPSIQLPEANAALIDSATGLQLLHRRAEPLGASQELAIRTTAAAHGRCGVLDAQGGVAAAAAGVVDGGGCKAREADAICDGHGGKVDDLMPLT